MKFEEGKLYTEKSEAKTGKGSILRFSHYEDKEFIAVFSIVKNSNEYMASDGGMVRIFAPNSSFVEWKNDIKDKDYDDRDNLDSFEELSKLEFYEGDVDNFVNKAETESLKRRLKAIDTALKMGGSMNDLLDKRIETTNKLELIS